MAFTIGEIIVNVLTTRCIVDLTFGRFGGATVQKLSGVDSQWSGRVSGRYYSWSVEYEVLFGRFDIE